MECEILQVILITFLTFIGCCGAGFYNLHVLVYFLIALDVLIRRYGVLSLCLLGFFSSIVVAFSFRLEVLFTILLLVTKTLCLYIRLNH